MGPALLAGLTGVIQGARHALEPDHVSAVASVMVGTPSPRRGIFYAACWGAGHAAMLLLVAGPLALFRVPLPDRLSTGLELGVGIMLVFLGARTLLDARARTGAAADHVHPPLVHGRRPFAIGVVHGLAGSGALAALVAVGAPSSRSALACLALYAVGTVFGMVGLATAAGPVLAHAKRAPAIGSVVARLSGAASLAIGAVWIVRTLSALTG